MQPPKDVRDYLSSESERLRGEYSELLITIRQLETKRDRMANKLKALSELLEDSKVAEDRANGNRIMSEIENPTRLAGIGIREAILKILQDNANGISPTEIASELKEGGFKYSGSTIIETRVSNELYRLQKSNRLRKLGRGQYAPLDH